MTDIDTGLFLGGAARQRNVNREIGVRERAVGLQENQLEFQRQTEIRNQVMEAIGNTTDQAVSLVQGVASRDQPGFSSTLGQIRANVEALARQAEGSGVGITASNVLSTFDNAVLSTQTAGEQAQAEAEANVTGARTTVGALGGSERDVGVLLGTEPLSPQLPPDIVRLQRERDAAEASGDTRRAAELTNIIARRGTVTGTTEFDPAQPQEFATALTTPTEEDVERLRTNLRDNSSMSQTAANTLAAVEEAGGLSTGFVGAATESITGILGNLGAIGDAVNAGIETVTGADLDKLTAARTRMREGVASALPEITEETSGRFTDTERRIASETLRGLTPDANIDQVISAYREFFRIINASDVRNAAEIARGANFDLTSPEGVDALASILMGNGVSAERTLEILDQVVPR